jgi:hypothetical protein
MLSKSSQSQSLRLRVVIFEDMPGTWVAQALEYDIAAQGPTKEGAVEALLRILEAQVRFDCRHNREPLACFCAAPHQYWNAFARATPLETRWFHINPQPNIPGQIVAAVARARPHRAGESKSARAVGAGRPHAPGPRNYRILGAA